MTVSTSKIMFERKPRYTIRDGQTVTVVVERDSQSDHPPVTAKLIDISETGAKLSTDC